MEQPERMFACRLAKALGKSLAEISSMPSSEFLTWQAYYDLEPFGSPVDDQRANALNQLLFQLMAERGAKVPTWFNRWEKPKADEPKLSMTDKINAFFAPHDKKAAAKLKRKQAAALKAAQASASINTENKTNNEV